MNKTRKIILIAALTFLAIIGAISVDHYNTHNTACSDAPGLCPSLTGPTDHTDTGNINNS